jgi:hypothetical protein
MKGAMGCRSDSRQHRSGLNEAGGRACVVFSLWESGLTQTLGKRLTRGNCCSFLQILLPVFLASHIIPENVWLKGARDAQNEEENH